MNKSDSSSKADFTSIEILAVIILLSVIALITYPFVDDAIRDSKESDLKEVINGLYKSG